MGSNSGSSFFGSLTELAGTMRGLQKALVWLCVGGGAGVSLFGIWGIGGGSILNQITGVWSLTQGS